MRGEACCGGPRFAAGPAVACFAVAIPLDHDPIKLNRIMISSLCLSMIFSENRFPLFRDHALPGISVAVVLPFDNLLGQMNQHPSGAMIPQLVEGPQQPQSKKCLQRTETWRRRKFAFSLLGCCRLVLEELQGDVECVRDLHQAVAVYSSRRIAVFLPWLKRCIEHFGEVGLRKDDS